MRFIFDKTITVHRPTLYASREEYFVVGDIKGFIMPVKAEDVMLTDGDPAKSFKMVCDLNEDVKEGDKIVCDSVTYIIKTIRRFDLRSLSRIEAFIYKPNN